MLEKYDKNGQAVTTQVEGIRAALSDPNNNWSKLVKSLWTDIDDEQRKKLVETVVINGTLIGTPATMKMQDKYQCNVPWAILMDPTSACNLRCTGCWAAEYGHNQNLTFEEMDRVLTEAKELGTHACLFTGGEFAGGCVAGGRIYCHINAAGDVEPCVFIHYSGANIREKSFLECLQQPLFLEYRKGQPFNGNHLRPCPMLENPELLPQMVARSGAHSTALEAPESVEHLCGKCKAYAACWQPTAEQLWDEEHRQ